MPAVVFSPLHALLALSIASIGLSQSTTETVWASFAYVLHGERTPVLGDSPVTLTPLGAQQLYSQGALFRARYLSNTTLSDEDNKITTNSPIVGLGRDAIDNSQLSIYSTTDNVVTGSTLAFLQGLYPPVTGGSNASTLANGSTIEYPLSGYQYPNIQTLSGLDPNSIWIDGHSGCAAYLSSGDEFADEAYSQQLYNASLDFYQTTWAAVFPDSALPASTVSFDHAYELYEYALYRHGHDETVRDALDAARLARLRTLADDREFALNNGGDLSAAGRESGDAIRAVAGRTLAGRVVAQLSSQIASAGSSSGKLTLAFGSHEPFLAFFALAGLADSNSSVLFRQVPQPGAAMVFELLSTTNDTSSYPDHNDLWVRFLYRNGTDPDAPLEEYPLFGGDAGARLRWADFRAGMGAFAIKDIAGWCRTCDAVTLFCIALDSDTNTDTSSDSGSSALFGSSSSVSPAVAGIIGAATTLAVVGVAAMLVFVLGGVRLRRSHGLGGHQHQRSSSLGGFKGAEKLASDHDVSIVKSGARHARVGSWELGGPGPVPTGGGDLPPQEDAAFFGASVHKKADGGDDADSIMGRAPIKPLESI
ncbi:histidine phosphatase superfamily [Biscogniauxia sp. FL1348]|nr:histidine phosphatase superfamily [Biscogniauxia sp. FL1348]